MKIPFVPDGWIAPDQLPRTDQRWGRRLGTDRFPAVGLVALLQQLQYFVCRHFCDVRFSADREVGKVGFALLQAQNAFVTVPLGDSCVRTW